MAFRKKFEKVIELKPDVLVLQECENKSKLEQALKTISYNQLIWYGKNPNKGVAVLSFNQAEIKLSKPHNPEFEYIIPVDLKVLKKSIKLFCIWAMPHKTQSNKSYVVQIWAAINYYTKALDEPSILIGDFNSNTIWDKKRRTGNHTDVVNFLAQKKIASLYHQKANEKHGQEKQPTLFLLKKKTKPYHIDYCFASKSLYNDKTKIEIGKYKDWIKLSDHMPIIVDNLSI